MMELNKIYCENCLDTMARMEDNSVDFVITSPPYNVGRNNMVEAKYDSKGTDTISESEYTQFLIGAVRELTRVSKYYVFFNIQMLSANKYSIIDLLFYCKDVFKERFVWDKSQVAPAIEPGVLNSKFEDVYVFTKLNPHKRKFDRCNFPQGRLNNVINGNNNSSNESSEKHRAGFPIYFPTFFIKHFTNEGEIIYDPFMGSGTTALACIKTNRNFIGSEISQTYVDLARKRIDQALRQEKLEFDS